MMIIVGTGPRDIILDDKKSSNLFTYLYGSLKAVNMFSNVHVIAGMAEGFDEILIKAAIANNIPYTLAIPNKTYINYYWIRNSLTKRDRTREADVILKLASKIIYVCDGIYGPDGRHANFHRNEWMMDRADVVWAYKPESGGTKQAYDYARSIDKQISLIPEV